MMAVGFRFSNIVDMEYFPQDRRLRIVCKAIVHELIFDNEENFKKFIKILQLVSFDDVQEVKAKSTKKFYIDTNPNRGDQ